MPEAPRDTYRSSMAKLDELLPGREARAAPGWGRPGLMTAPVVGSHRDAAAVTSGVTQAGTLPAVYVATDRRTEPLV